MRFRLLPMLLAALPVLAQDPFPRFSVTAASSASSFDTNVRIDPELADGEGTLVSFERDLGLEDSRTLRRFGLQWRPSARHELAATYFSAPRSGFQQIDREITFRNEIYPVSAAVTTRFDLESWSATYTYWAGRSFGISLGLADLALDASVTAARPGQTVTVTVTERADTDVPVALAGVQTRWAFSPRILADASIAALPRVTIEDFTGHALQASARVEYRPLRWLGLGVAYSYFRLDVDVGQADLTGALDMTIRGPEGFVRLGF